MFFTCGCSADRAAILFNQYPITKENIYNYSRAFPRNARIYYIILMPRRVESRYLYVQIIKKDNSYGRFGYNLIWTKNTRLKDDEVKYFTDYFVLNEKGFYIMKVYSKDNPHKVLTSAEFYVSDY